MVVNGVISKPLSVTSGVSQGSILGPLIFIDDIANITLSEGAISILYADLYRPIWTSQDYDMLQGDVDALQAYASDQYMTFNRSKCKFMLVSRSTLSDPIISLYGLPLETTTTFKYLGVLLTSDPSWSGHVKNVCSKQGS